MPLVKKYAICSNCETCHVYYEDECPWKSGCKRIKSVDKDGNIKLCGGELYHSHVRPQNSINPPEPIPIKPKKTDSRVITCSQCGQTGHNKRTCQEST